MRKKERRKFRTGLRPTGFRTLPRSDHRKLAETGPTSIDLREIRKQSAQKRGTETRKECFEEGATGGVIWVPYTVTEEVEEI